MQGELAELLGQYGEELQAISALLSRQPPHPHLTLLSQKIALRLGQLAHAQQQLAGKQLSPAAVAQLGAFYKQSFAGVIKEAHRMVQVRPQPDGQQRLAGKISVIREMEEEMGSAWEGGQGEGGVLRRLQGGLTTLAGRLAQGELRSVAREYLQKEFLAIRVVAYRLYEQYTAHSHLQLRQHLQELRAEQEQLQGAAEELREANREIKAEEKRMVRELNELRKVNDLIGKRYFVDTQASQ